MKTYCRYGHIQSAIHRGNSFKPCTPAQTNLKPRRSGTNTGVIVAALSSIRALFADRSEAWVGTRNVTSIHSSLKLEQAHSIFHRCAGTAGSSTWKSAALTVLYLCCEHFQVFRALSVKKKSGKKDAMAGKCLSYYVQVPVQAFSNSGDVSA